MLTRMNAAVLILAVLIGVWTVRPLRLVAQVPADSVLDEILDRYVRDGLVYYAALRRERGALDRYVASLVSRPEGFEEWSIERQRVYWINGYNALVLHAIIDQYPIRGSSSSYPQNSVMQLAGIFSGQQHQIAGERFTLQEIEDTLTGLGDARVILALGRGAVGSPRLRSEAFSEQRLEAQLQAVVDDFATTPRHVWVDRTGGEIVVSAVIGWRTDQFSTLAGPDEAGTGRTLLERAVVALIAPALFPVERAFLAQNTFRLRYRDFDWRLNDLTGGPPPPRLI